MSQTPKDYSSQGRVALVALVVVLILVSFIPAQTVCGVKLRRANILSDLITFEEPHTEVAEQVEPELFDEEEFEIDMTDVSEQIQAIDSTPKNIQTTYTWLLDHEREIQRQVTPAEHDVDYELTPIEDFSEDHRMEAFYDTLLHAQRPVRIAFMGDSFVEGDILTGDLREQFQVNYGGGGAGFAPIASPLTAFRRTIRTQSKGWQSYNIMQYKRAPESLRDNFYISGWACAPTQGASTRWEATDNRRKLEDCTTARVLFKSPSTSHVEVILNDSLHQAYTIEGSPTVRQIVVSADQIANLTFKVKDGTQGFVGYGAIFEEEGVVVDNYSIRSNNGQAMFRTNPTVNAQINDLVHYDLVILQYGLNIMQQGIYGYRNYATQIEKMIDYVRECFPTAAVLVMGVSDRSVRTDHGFEPMDAIPHMTKYQREAARTAGASFWATSTAMEAMGGMKEFVANGWAGKDYTHINFLGGRRIAHALFAAFNQGVKSRYEQQQIIERQKQMRQAVIDSLQATKIDQRLIIGHGSDTLNRPAL